jgi:hypothetical protein
MLSQVFYREHLFNPVQTLGYQRVLNREADVKA